MDSTLTSSTSSKSLRTAMAKCKREKHKVGISCLKRAKWSGEHTSRRLHAGLHAGTAAHAGTLQLIVPNNPDRYSAYI